MESTHTYIYTNLIKFILIFLSLIWLQLLEKQLTQNVTETVIGKGPTSGSLAGQDHVRSTTRKSCASPKKTRWSANIKTASGQ